MPPSSARVFGGTKGAQTALVASLWAPSRVHSEPFLQFSASLRREILGSPGRSESQQLVSDFCNKRSIRGVAKGQKCLCPTRIGLGTGPRGGDCYRELPRIPLPRTPVNKGKKEGRGCPKPRPSARDALAYLEEPCLLLCEGVARQVLRPRGDHRLVGDPTT